MRTSLGPIKAQSPAIRLSYHSQSHYNSVMDEKKHQQTVLTSTPGVLEDEHIRKAKQAKSGGLGSDLQRAIRLSDAEATEMDALRRVLGLSVTEFNSKQQGRNAFDEVVLRSRVELNERFEREMEEAKRRSEVEMTEQELITATKEDSRNELKRADEQVMTKVLEESQAEDMRRAMRESLADKSWPLPIQQTVMAGFNFDQASLAYSIYALPKVPDEIVARNMLMWLKAQKAPGSPAARSRAEAKNNRS